MKHIKFTFAILFSFFISTVSPSFLFADVTVESFFKTGGIGGMGASEIQQKEYVKGLKKREDTKTKFTGAILGRLTKEQSGSIVYRVDKDVTWNIDHSGKSYTEQPIYVKIEEEPSAEDEGKDEGKEDEEEKKEDEVKIIRNEFKVNATGAKKTINGFPCEQYILTWLVETENVKTKERAKNVMTTELWNTPEDGNIKMLMKEEGDFNQAYMKKLGLEMSPEEINKFGLKAMGAVMSSAAEDLKKEMSKIKGYSIVTAVKWEAESDKHKKAEKEEVPEVSEDEDKGIDISKGLGGIMGGLMKKKMEEKKKKDKEEKGDKAIFESYNEIKGIDTSALADSIFDIPAGYKKVK